MNITTVLFDLDGTLLPMDNNEFAKGCISAYPQGGFEQLIDYVNKVCL